MPIYQPLRDAYLHWMRDYQHAAAGTLELRSRSISQFLRWLGPQATPQGCLALSAETIERFFLPYAQKMGRSARRSMQAALRTFFGSVYIRAMFNGHSSALCRPGAPISWPRFHVDSPMSRRSKFSRALTETATWAGAITRLASCSIPMGCEAAKFALCDTKISTGLKSNPFPGLQTWQRQSLALESGGGRKPAGIPKALALGLPDPHVFLTSRAPYHALLHANALSAVVERHLRKAGIELSSKGAHAFRHGFATRMLQQGHSLKAIADVLGHRHLGTTFIYTKVDFNSLKQVALPWPQEVAP